MTGRQQADLMAEIASWCRDHAVPPLDRGLRSIVVQQTANLLRGGWSLDEIRPVAIELASRYERAVGHAALTGLQRTLERADEGRGMDAHEARVREEREAGLDPRVRAILQAGRARRDLHPSRHAFLHNGQHCSCTDAREAPHPACGICRGPEGVHRRLLAIDEDDRALVVPAR
jgi:hypothetical protein